jgi:hypothetical protein
MHAFGGGAVGAMTLSGTVRAADGQGAAWAAAFLGFAVVHGVDLSKPRMA